MSTKTMNICDRCGKEMKRERFFETFINRFRFKHKDAVDLCNQCCEEFMNFMKTKPQINIGSKYDNEMF